ncbi:hypothetical protein BDA96_10G180200 [Sorghum bicolor]|uniref:Uncharacterized protein n=1 Tax=Sorghum bicolor TaxID=4558 RepID=A0A921U1C2_SORBI|nr:hypothetical protein BDA96_10G180200 [Sorghum bicolor]
MEGLDELIGLIADLEPDIGTADLDFDDVDIIFDVGIGVSLAKPEKAKPKGRTKDKAELRVLKLGARGPKLMSRKCKICGVADGHNASTCLKKEANHVRLASLSCRKRGRPPGLVNRNTMSRAVQGVDNQREINVSVTGDRCVSETDGTATKDSNHTREPSMTTRKRGRPAGSKNKCTI